MYNTNAMKKRKLLAKRPKAKNGQKRQAVIKHILLPEELVAELQLYKQAYSDVLNQKVSWEQMLHRWMENIGRFDPDVKLRVEAMKTPVTTPEQTVEQQVEQPAIDQTFHADPTEGNVWDMKYYFEKDGKRLEAEWAKSDKASFSVKINNRSYGVREMLKKGWLLKNEGGIEITEEQAMVIAQKRRKHQEDIEFQRASEMFSSYRDDSSLEEYDPIPESKIKMQKDGEVIEIWLEEMPEYCDKGWTYYDFSEEK